jgi:myosin heavy subunit
MGSTLIIVGAIAVAAIILLVPQIRQQVASFLRIIVGKGYKASTTPIDREMDEYNKAKAKLVDATNNVQTVLGQARTQKRALDTAQAAVTKAEGDVRDAQSMNITGDDLNKYIDALTEAKSTLAAQATRTQTAAKAAEQAQARLEAATKEVQKFAKQIEADKGDMALANALNATTDITRMTADITSGLSKASEAHNEVQSALDRAQAGVDMVTPKADPLEEARKARERQATLDALNGKK